jgi:hypothetical protein
MSAIGPSQLLEQFREQLVVFASYRYPVEATRSESEVERPADPHLLVGTRGRQRPLSTPAHPAETHFGVGFQPGLILKERSRFFHHYWQDIFEPPALLLSLIF